jgi:ribonuclease III
MNQAEQGSLTELEERVGHRFGDHALLTQALTHISRLASERRRVGSYQRLEFLGDRVLGLAVSAMLYAEFPEAEEGEMSRRLAALVRRETCAEVAVDWGVGPFVRLGGGEANTGGRKKAAILSDVCEAIIGAVFVDAGFEAAQAVIRAAWRTRMLEPSRPLQDPKTALQEWAQSLGKPAPVYRQTARTGPDHAPQFTVSVAVDGYDEVPGQGSSKRFAEQAAADAFLTSHELQTANKAAP